VTFLTLSAGPHAFGDGAHPTTRGVLEALAMMDPAQFTPRNACDMGAGSGIISFALIEKFGCKVVAVDVEASAVATLKENAVRNGLDYSLRAGEAEWGSGDERWNSPSPPPHPTLPRKGGGLHDGVASVDPKRQLFALHADGFNHRDIAASAPYDMITMNILAEPLMRLADAACNHLAADGVMILSGILQWQETQIRQAYASLGLSLSARLVVGDWVTLVWQK